MKYKMKKIDDPIKITRSVINQIEETIGSYKVETGGILFAKNNVIQEVIFDKGGSCSHGAYDPDYVGLNEILKKKEAEGFVYVGSIHSHPRGVRYPSGDWGNNTGDHGAIKANLKCNPELDKFIALIAYSTYDGGKFELFSFVVYRKEIENIYETSLEIQEEELNQDPEKKPFVLDTNRLVGGVDIELMKKSKIVVVGVGGANQIVESLVRTNAHNLICIDFDTVDTNNLITQGYYVNEIGKPKVEALGNRLKQINPEINYEGINANLFDLDEDEIEGIFSDADLLLMMTDSFDAQVKGNQLSLKYGIPAIFALMYYKGCAGEISFNIPDIFSLSHKDALIERYAANFDSKVESVTSTGGTIFQTQYLNGAIGIMALHILHRHLPDNFYGGVFNKDFDCNFIQLRMNKDYSAQPGNMFYEASKSNIGVKFFDAIWRQVLPANENPEVDLVGKEWFHKT